MNVQFPPAALVPALLNPSSPAGPRTETSETFHEALAGASKDDKKLVNTAKQFEAVMASEILKAARSSSQGWLGTGDGDDQTGEMTVELAEQGLAQGLASTGGFGIAKMVLENLRRDHATDTSSAPPASR